MKTDYFYWLLNMSIAGTLTGFLVVALGRVKAIPKTFIYMLWAVPAFRFLVPVSFSSRFSVMNLVIRLHGRAVPLEALEGSEESARLFLTYANYHQAAREVLPVQSYRYEWLEKVFALASWVWLLAALGLGVAVMFAWVKTNRSHRRGVKDADGLFRSDSVTGPVVFGLLKPGIAVPVNWDGRNKEYVLMHERVHIRRRDNLFRLLAVAVVLIHWFNPFVWLLVQRFFADLELSCDEMVIRDLNEEQKREYASVLIGQLAQRSVFSSAFGGAAMKGRIERILTYRSLTGLSWLAAALLVTAVALAMTANPV